VTDVLVAQIDPESNLVVARYGPASGSGGVAADDDAVWISAHDVTTIWRIPIDRSLGEAPALSSRLEGRGPARQRARKAVVCCIVALKGQVRKVK
jgi:hypothetical protein